MPILYILMIHHLVQIELRMKGHPTVLLSDWYGHMARIWLYLAMFIMFVGKNTNTKQFSFMPFEDVKQRFCSLRLHKLFLI